MEAASIVFAVAFVLVLILVAAVQRHLPTYRAPDKRGRVYIAGEPGAYMYVDGSSSSSSDCGAGSSGGGGGCDGGSSS